MASVPVHSESALSQANNFPDSHTSGVSSALAEELNSVAKNGEQTMRLIIGLWDCVTHCAEPALYHETTQKLQEALGHEISKVTSLPPKPIIDLQPRTLTPKEADWEGYKIYQVQFDSKGTPIPDPEWPATTRFVQGITSKGIPYFVLFENENAAFLVDTTDPDKERIFLPQLKDDRYLVYKAGKKYLSGSGIYNDQGKIIHERFNPLLRFNFAEHALMGNKANLTFDTSTSQAKNVQFKLRNGLALTYGEITALGGDFFGTATPIMRGKNFEEQCDLFKKAFATLAEAGGGFTSAIQIEHILGDETKQIGEATNDGQHTADTLELYRKMKASAKALSDEDKALDDATRDPSRPSYLALAQLNLDHFGQSAVIAYNAGHYCAMQKAKEGDLSAAYAMNAFADHFLGDSFSSGHFRTPREVLHGGDDDVQKAIDVIVHIAGQSTLTGMAEQLGLEILTRSSSLIKTLLQLAPDFCAKYMHDEDSIRGLHVTNHRGDHWQAFGDAKLFTNDNALNAKFMAEALQISVHEIWNAHKNFKDKSIPLPDSSPADLYQVWNIAPSAEQPNRNHQPLFDNVGSRRSPWTDPQATKRDKNNQLLNNYEFWAIEFARSDYFKKLK